MSAIAKFLNAFCTAASLLLLFNLYTMPSTLALSTTSRIFPEASIGKARRKEVVTLIPADEQSYVVNINCDTVPGLCAELRTRPMQNLEVWLASPGYMQGDWMARAVEGGKEWVSLREQNKRFLEVRSFNIKLTAIFVMLALASAYFAYFRRRAITV